MSYILIQLLAKAISVTVLILLAVLVSPRDLGIYYQVVLVAAAFQVALDGGRSRSLQRELSAASLEAVGHLVRGQRNHLFRCWALFVCLLPLVLVLRTEVVLLGVLAVSLAAVQCVASLYESVLLGLGQNRAAGLTSVVGNSVLLLGVAALLHHEGATALPLVSVQLLAGACAAAAAGIFIPRGLLAATTGPVSLYRRPTAVLNIAAFAYYRADAVLIAALLPPSALAAYGTAYRFLELGGTILQLAQVARLRAHVQAASSEHFRTTITVLVAVATALAVVLSGGVLVARLFLPELGGVLEQSTLLLTALLPALVGIGLSQAAAVAVYASLQHRANRSLTTLSIVTALGSLALNAIVLLLTRDVFVVASVQPLIELLAALALIWALRRVVGLGPTRGFIFSCIALVLACLLVIERPLAVFILLGAALVISVLHVRRVTAGPFWRAAVAW